MQITKPVITKTEVIARYITIPQYDPHLLFEVEDLVLLGYHIKWLISLDFK